MAAGARQKVVVAMSGGVDSSVAAALLLEQGFEVVGCFMRLGSDDSVEAAEPVCQTGSGNLPVVGSHHQGCCSLNDAADARMVAAMLGIPFYVLNFKKDFGRIIDYFVSEYNAGRTPNPCVRCNDWLKFGKLAAYAESIHAAYIATGHYARVDHIGPRPRLLRGVDHKKDQSYVLFGTRREALAHMLLPIGDLEKSRVRALAQARGLPVFDKPDSQEICFVPDNDYAALVASRSPQHVRPGNLLDERGQILGQHPGQQHFTIGQRRGLGVALGQPAYVIAKDAVANTVTIGPKDRLLSSGLQADQANWLIDLPLNQPVRCQVKIRYNSPPTDATVYVTGPDTFRAQFDQPQFAVTAGQAAVCYRGDELVGGGWITHADDRGAGDASA